MIRTYPLRTSRKKWDIKFYAYHNNSKKIFQSFIKLHSYDKDNPRTNDGILLDSEEIVIPDSSFTISIYFPLSYVFEIFIHSSQSFSRKLTIHTIKSIYSFIYDEEERTSTPQLFSLKKVCSKCNLQDIQSFIEKISDVKENCSICFTELNSHPVKLKCNHIFHIDCISQWVKTSATCPICRYNIFMCSNCNGQRIIYFFYTGAVLPLEQRGENTFRNITNGTFGIHSYDLEDLNLDEMMYDNINKKLYIKVSASTSPL